jgi:serine/threonine protein kinase
MADLHPALKTLLRRPPAERKIGPFRLEHELGKGGFAPVYLAKEVYGDKVLRSVAVKLFGLDPLSQTSVDSSGSTRKGPSTRDHILEEARLLCQVEHPNIVRFYSAAMEESLGVMGLAMEYIAGTSLKERLFDGPLSIEDTLTVGTAVASALSVVHRAGLVHRDVKPQNIVESSGVSKLIDFGIALTRSRSTTEQAPKLRVLGDVPVLVPPGQLSAFGYTNTEGTLNDEGLASLSGTTGYIAPECMIPQVRATPASDLYALGVVLFECLTGRLPSQSQDGLGLLREILCGERRPQSLGEVMPSAPPALVRLVDSLLEPTKEKRPRSAEAVAQSLERLRSETRGRSRALPAEAEGPFRGLGRFEEAHRGVYFGRHSEMASCLERLRGTPVLAMLGPSGSGKSSLARAGVLPAIVEGALGRWPKHWDPVLVTPGNDPKASLRRALAPLFGDVQLPATPEAIVASLGERTEAIGRGTVLLVDQLEELATLSSGESQRFLVQLLVQLGEQVLPGVRTVVAARRDLLDGLLALEGLGKVLTQGTFLVFPLSDGTWEEVIDHALGVYGYRFEPPAVREELLRQLQGTATAMPLVQFALTELWKHRDTAKKSIGPKALESIGGIQGALQRHGEATLAKLGDPERTRDVLLALTTADGTAKAFERESRLLERFPGERTQHVLEGLQGSRLVVQESEGLTLAHDQLLTVWGTLAGWLAEAREDRLLAMALERDAGTWHEVGHASEHLWKKRRLVAGEDLARRGSVPISKDATTFLRASRGAERRGRLIVGAAALLVFLGAGGGGVAYVKGMATKNREIQTALTAARASEGRAKEESERARAAEGTAEGLRKDAEIAQGTAETQRKDFEKRWTELEERVRQAKNAKELAALQSEIREKRDGPTVKPQGGTATPFVNEPPP